MKSGFPDQLSQFGGSCAFAVALIALRYRQDLHDELQDVWKATLWRSCVIYDSNIFFYFKIIFSHLSFNLEKLLSLSLFCQTISYFLSYDCIADKILTNVYLLVSPTVEGLTRHLWASWQVLSWLVTKLNLWLKWFAYWAALRSSGFHHVGSCAALPLEPNALRIQGPRAVSWLAHRVTVSRQNCHL